MRAWDDDTEAKLPGLRLRVAAQEAAHRRAMKCGGRPPGMPRLCAANLGRLGPRQQLILETLPGNGRPLTQATIIERTGIAANDVARVVAALAARNLVTLDGAAVKRTSNKDRNSPRAGSARAHGAKAT